MAKLEERPLVHPLWTLPDTQAPLLSENQAELLPVAATMPAIAPQSTQANSQAAASSPLFQEYAYPTTAHLGSEQVDVKSAKETTRAQTLMTHMQSEYGIEVSSATGVASLLQQYDKVPEAQRSQIRTETWQLKELEALNRAMARFAPLLGKRREESRDRDIPQQVTTASKLHEALTSNGPTGHVDGNEMKKAAGEHFTQGRNISLFASGTNRPDLEAHFSNEQNLEATAIHELAHGLLGHRVLDFAKAVGYWNDPLNDVSTRVGGEQAMTRYGATNPDEDLAESVKFFFMNPKKLKEKCPDRYDFIEREVASWNAKKK